MELDRFIERMLLDIKQGIDKANKDNAIQAGYPNEIEIDIALCDFGEVCDGKNCSHPEKRMKTKIYQLYYPWLEKKTDYTDLIGQYICGKIDFTPEEWLEITKLANAFLYEKEKREKKQK